MENVWLQHNLFLALTYKGIDYTTETIDLHKGDQVLVPLKLKMP
jgi:hypothetical protein